MSTTNIKRELSRLSSAEYRECIQVSALTRGEGASTFVIRELIALSKLIAMSLKQNDRAAVANELRDIADIVERPLLDLDRRPASKAK